MNLRSAFLTLSENDFAKGLIVAILSAVISFLYQLITNGGNIFELATLQQIGSAALLAGLAYLSKNLLTNSDGEFGKAEN